MNPVKERRFGRFSVNVEMLREDDTFVNAFYDCGIIVLDARVDPCTDNIEYRAAWYRFDVVPFGAVVPEYKLLFDGEYVTPVLKDGVYDAS